MYALLYSDRDYIMQCFTVTEGRPNRFRVLKLIEHYGWEPTFVCDTPLQKKRLALLGVPKNRIVVSDVPKDAGITGVSRARDFVVRELMPHDEWCIWIDDNLQAVTGIPYSISLDRLDFNDGRDWRKLFKLPVRPRTLERQIEETIDRAEELGTIFAAFANEDNFFFRSNKWQLFGYCRTQFALYKNDGSTWYPFDGMMFEDGYKSVDVVARYGCVLINRHVKADKPMFERGGIGSFDKRLPHLQHNCRKIAEQFPGLVKLAGNSNQYGSEARDFHIKFAKRSLNTVAEWRKANGYL